MDKSKKGEGNRPGGYVTRRELMTITSQGERTIRKSTVAGT